MTTTTQQLNTELLEELRYVRAHTSRTAEILATGVKNNVLEVGTRVIPASGMIQLAWAATCGSIAVRNLSAAHPVVVAAGPASITPTGIGSWTVPAGEKDVVNTNSRVLTLYGTAGESLCYQAWTVGARPGVE
jgi:hypothetical protein